MRLVSTWLSYPILSSPSPFCFCSFPFQMHLEAAKVLSFTEEEFVKALDWGSQ